MEMWKKPNITIYNQNNISDEIKAKAYTIGEAMEIGALCDQGVGSCGVIQLPSGVVTEAYVAFFNAIDEVFTIIANGIRWFWSRRLRKFI